MADLQIFLHWRLYNGTDKTRKNARNSPSLYSFAFFSPLCCNFWKLLYVYLSRVLPLPLADLISISMSCWVQSCLSSSGDTIDPFIVIYQHCVRTVPKSSFLSKVRISSFQQFWGEGGIQGAINELKEFVVSDGILLTA